MLLLSGAVSARDAAPPAIQQTLDADCEPTCGLCHDNPEGGGSRNRPFFKNAFGLSPFDPTNAVSVADMLEAVAAAGTDSDGDGTTDIDEIIQCSDPNVPGTDVIERPDYGCLTVAPLSPVRPPAPWGTATAALGIGIAIIARRRLRR